MLLSPNMEDTEGPPCDVIRARNIVKGELARGAVESGCCVCNPAFIKVNLQSTPSVVTIIEVTERREDGPPL